MGHLTQVTQRELRPCIPPPQLINNEVSLSCPSLAEILQNTQLFLGHKMVRKDNYKRKKDDTVQCRVCEKEIKEGSKKKHMLAKHPGEEHDLRTLAQAQHAPKQKQVLFG